MKKLYCFCDNSNDSDLPTSEETSITIQEKGISVTLDLDRAQQRELFIKLARQMGRAELAMAYSQVLMERDLEGVAE